MAATPADEDVCFICLEGATQELGQLGRHCKCPSLTSHKTCLLRWQLQQAGGEEEKHCRFCKSALGDWRSALESEELDGAPLMSVTFQGKKCKVPVSTGPEGKEEFKRTVCRLFNLPEDTEFEITFECKSPIFGDKLRLKGFQCFEAATYCAAVASAKHAKEKASKAAAGGKTGSSASKRGAVSKSPAASSTSPSPSSTSSAAPPATTPATSSPAHHRPAPDAPPTTRLPRTRSTPNHQQLASQRSGSPGQQLDSDASLPSVHLDGAQSAAPGMLESATKASSQLRTSLSSFFRRVL